MRVDGHTGQRWSYHSQHGFLLVHRRILRCTRLERRWIKDSSAQGCPFRMHLPISCLSDTRLLASCCRLGMRETNCHLKSSISDEYRRDEMNLPDSPDSYVRPWYNPLVARSISRPSRACMTPAVHRRARYPPPLEAIPTVGRDEVSKEPCFFNQSPRPSSALGLRDEI